MGASMASETQASLSRATERLFDLGLMGLVLLNSQQRIESVRGALVDWVDPEAKTEDALPFLVGYEETLRDIAVGDMAPLVLPAVSMASDSPDEGRVYAIQVYRWGEAGELALVFHDGTTVAALERSVMQHRNELALAERALKAARDAAEAADRAKTAFLSNISHELRTPLHVIIGDSEILNGAVESPLPSEDVAVYAKDINDNGVYLLELIDDLLDLSKAEAGRMDLVEEAVGLTELCEEVIGLAGRLDYAKEKTFRLEQMPGLPALRADRRRVKQMLLNLLSNAAKFTAAGDKIVLRADWQPESGHRLTVCDAGPGMTEAELGRVLEPFVQGRQGTSAGQSVSGTGLGLPLVRSLMDLHGGSLDLRSQPGKGTAASLRFPLGRALTEDQEA